MKGVILHHEENRTYLLGQDGIFRRIRRVRDRAVGEEIDIPFSLLHRGRLLVSVAAVIAMALIVVFAIAFGASAYYVCVDVNPSVELSFNIFHRLTGARALDAEGGVVLEGLTLKGGPEQAMDTLLAAINAYEYITNNPDGKPDVCITVVGRDKDARAAVEQRLMPLLADAGSQSNIFVGSCDLEYRERAESMGVSAGMLMWAERFREYNEEIPLADVLEMPVGELVDGVRSQQNPW